MKGALGLRAQRLPLEAQRGSLPSVASGLRCWQAFAVSVLRYPEDSTLPPRSEEDVALYVSVFNNAGTAANYVRYLRWACSELQLDVDWMSPRISAQLKGLEKMHIRLAPDQGPRCHLTRRLVSQVVQLATSLGDIAFAALVAISWEFLLRVQSEALELTAGSSDSVLALPPTAKVRYGCCTCVCASASTGRRALSFVGRARAPSRIPLVLRVP